MQSFSWYLRRLRAMSAAEVRWRLSALAREGADAACYAVGRRPSPVNLAAAVERLSSVAAPALNDVARGEWTAAPAGSLEARWLVRLRAQADAVVAHRLRIFDVDVEAGDPIEWNRDHLLGMDTPRGFAPWIDYRDVRDAGDAKVVWEPNRHLHFVVLARAYRATGEARYAEELVRQWTSWLDQCPFPTGMNWRSPLELGIRAINWVWSLDAIRDAGVLAPATLTRVLDTLYLLLWDTARKFSSGSSANNHLIGEAAGVFVGACYVPEFDPAGRWRDDSRAILEREILRQTTADGCTAEHAFGYQVFVAQLLLAAGMAGRRTGHDLSTAFWGRLERMIEWVHRMSEGGPMPYVGDADDGYALDFGRDRDDVAALVAVGAALFSRSDFARLASEPREPVRWWLGAAAVQDWHRLVPASPAPALAPYASPASGYYLLQAGAPGEGDGISVLFDCAPLGFTELAAHGHADALSVVVRAFGREVFVDTGTYDYFTYPEWRAYFRSTRAHNTVEVDGRDQSEQQGLFLWGARAEASASTWRVTDDLVTVSGQHDGYRRLADPVTHVRAVDLHVGTRSLRIADTLTMQATHAVRLHLHCAEDADVRRAEDGRWEVRFGPHLALVTFDARFDVRVVRGVESPIGGWVSRGYHQRRPTCAFVAEARDVRGTTTFETVVEFTRGMAGVV